MSEIEYYFCEEKNITSKRQTFYITPKSYFDKHGFLLDTSSFIIDLPDFQRVADSTFEYVGKENAEIELLKDGRFMWRDMNTEIKYTYKRRELINE